MKENMMRNDQHHHPATKLEIAFWVLLGALLLANVTMGQTIPGCTDDAACLELIQAKQEAAPAPEEPGIMARIFGAARTQPSGVGFMIPPGAQACWQGGSLGPGPRHYPIDQSLDPWDGRDKTPSLSNAGELAVFNERYKGGNNNVGWNCGQALEAFSLNVLALQNACEGKCSAIPVTGGGGTCQPTAMEAWDLATTVGRCDGKYRLCTHDVGPGAPGDPIPYGKAAWKWQEGSLAHEEGICEAGDYELSGPMCGWKVWYRVSASDLPAEIPWCDEEPIDPDPPLPEECKWWTERFAETRTLKTLKRQRPGITAQEAREWVSEHAPTSPLAAEIEAECGEVVEPPEEPVPDVCRIVDVRITTRFRPGLPSTGQSTTEIRDEREEECP